MSFDFLENVHPTMDCIFTFLPSGKSYRLKPKDKIAVTGQVRDTLWDFKMVEPDPPFRRGLMRFSR